MPGLGDGGPRHHTGVRGKVLYWVSVSGAQACIHDGEQGLTRIFTLSPTHSRAAVCVDEDERVFVFDLSWELLSEHLADLDMAPVKWYGSIDEAIVTTTMELRDKVSR